LALIEAEWNGFDRKRETIAFFEGGDVFDGLVAGVADFQEIGFEQRDAVGKEFGERAVEIVAQRGVQGILKNVG